MEQLFDAKFVIGVGRVEYLHVVIIDLVIEVRPLMSFTRRVVACTVASMFLNTITEEPLRLAYVFCLALSAFETIYNERSVEYVFLRRL